MGKSKAVRKRQQQKRKEEGKKKRSGYQQATRKIETANSLAANLDVAEPVLADLCRAKAKEISGKQQAAKKKAFRKQQAALPVQTPSPAASVATACSAPVVAQCTPSVQPSARAAGPHPWSKLRKLRRDPRFPFLHDPEI